MGFGRGWKFVGVVAAAGLVVAVAGAGVAGADSDTGDPTPTAPRFVAKCAFSHTLRDDPIVHPGMPGVSHSHDFFANTKTDAFTTAKSLKRKGGTTCVDQLDRSGYWVPSLTVDGASVTPTTASIYYASATKPFKKVKTIPKGLEVVAGNSMATSPQSLKVASWDCSAKETPPESSTAPTCPNGDLTLHVSFPDCWNGTSLDSPDHASHLAYHGPGGACPSGYPVPIPRLRMNVHYPSTGGPGVALASGGQFSGHADFFNGWDPKELRRLVKTCINAGITCKGTPS